MITRNLLAAIISAAALMPAALSQPASPSPSPEVKRGVWRAELPGGIYIVRLSSITSLSLHEYVVDGAARVAEVNVATSGSELARFYFIEPLAPKSPVGLGQSGINLVTERAGELLARTGADSVTNSVLKNYPASTHAHTIEYRIESKDMLQKLFDSAEKAWLDERAGTFKP